MRRDSELLQKIMEEFELRSRFETRAPKEAYHVALLESMGCVKADVSHNEAGEWTYARIYMITGHGYDILDGLREHDKSAGLQEELECHGLTDAEKAAADEAYKVEVEETRLYETRMHLADFGGISVILLVCKGYMECMYNGTAPFVAAHTAAFKFVPLAIMFWGLTEIMLVISHGLSAKAHNVFQHKIYDGDIENGWNTGWRTATLWANRIAGLSFSLGVLTAVIFMFKLVF